MGEETSHTTNHGDDNSQLRAIDDGYHKDRVGAHTGLSWLGQRPWTGRQGKGAQSVSWSPETDGKQPISFFCRRSAVFVGCAWVMSDLIMVFVFLLSWESSRSIMIEKVSRGLVSGKCQI